MRLFTYRQRKLERPKKNENSYKLPEEKYKTVEDKQGQFIRKEVQIILVNLQ